MSEAQRKYLKKRKIRLIVTHLLRVCLLAAFIGGWELVAKSNVIDPFIISSPSRIVKVLGTLQTSGELSKHVLASLYETVAGFLIATVLGSAIAVLLWCSSLLRDVLEPYVITLNSLPKIALGPIIIVWMGIGKPAIIFMAVLICVIITIISMLAGFCSVDKEKILLLKSRHAGKFRILTKLVLPANVPTLISVLKINVGLSWVGSIMGEYLSSREGLGYLIVYGSQIFQLDLVM
ncbi:MAG: ABC transporter permease, partial [Clostridia bacterium]|nr:ABC transporter permease [Clostridia bacterium]